MLNIFRKMRVGNVKEPGIITIRVRDLGWPSPTDTVPAAWLWGGAGHSPVRIPALSFIIVIMMEHFVIPNKD